MIFRITILTFYCLLTLSGGSLLGQDTGAYYYFEGEDVVFEFDTAKYLHAQRMLKPDQLAFSDLNISEVIITHYEKKWTKDGWRMQKTPAGLYQLRKKIKSFGKGFDWDFRYLINQKHWVVPDIKYGVLVSPENILTDIYQFDPNEVQEVDTGSVLFRLEGYEDAEVVILTGSFNAWDEHKIRMRKTNGGWESRLNLPTGRYEYKFIVDGKWMHDKSNKNKVLNEHLTFNSVLEHFKEVSIFLNGYTDAQEVYIAGTFNRWKQKKHPLTKTETGWKTTIHLMQGKHFYKFIVDGKWIVDPGAENELDPDGHINSVLIVE